MTQFKHESTHLLWQSPPHALGTRDEDTPQLQAFQSQQPSDRAFLILPGGGYHHLSEHEGAGYARWLNSIGIHAFVLRYRLGANGYHYPVPVLDAVRAMRYLRFHASQWGIRSDRIGVIGSSAGGHLATQLLAWQDHSASEDPIDQLNHRPDLGILCYPVISMSQYPHLGSRRQLLGADADSQALASTCSAERTVAPDHPPCFIWHPQPDGSVPVEHSLLFAQALQRQGIPYELHIFQQGRHGMGLADGHRWSNLCAAWINEVW